MLWITREKWNCSRDAICRAYPPAEEILFTGFGPGGYVRMTSPTTGTRAVSTPVKERPHGGKRTRSRKDIG